MKGGKGRKTTHSHKRDVFDVSYKETTKKGKLAKAFGPTNLASVTRVKSGKIGSKIRSPKADTNYKSTRSRKGRARK